MAFQAEEGGEKGEGGRKILSHSNSSERFFLYLGVREGRKGEGGSPYQGK